MTENLQNNDLEANQTENETTEEVIQENQTPEENISPETDKKEEKTVEIPEWAAELKNELKAQKQQFDHLSQIFGAQPQYSSAPVYNQPTINDEEAKKRKEVEEIVRRMDEEKAVKERAIKLDEDVGKARQKHKDFDEKVYYNNDMPKISAVVQIASEHPEGMEILYQLVTENKERFEKMKNMTPVNQIREFGKLEAILEKKKEKADGNPTKQEQRQVPEPLSIIKETGIGDGGDEIAQIKKKFRKNFTKTKI